MVGTKAAWFGLLLILVGISTFPLEHGYSIEEYSIETVLISKRPINPVPGNPVFITLNVTDIFGSTMTSSLQYSTDDGRSWDEGSVRLIHGIPTNGTYLGTIPVVQSSGETIYQFDFEDDLGYTGTFGGRYSLTIDTDLPTIGEPGIRIFAPDQQIRMTYQLRDSGVGIISSKVYYKTSPSDSLSDQIEASLNVGDVWDGYYVAYIPAQINGTRVDYRIEAIDAEGRNAVREGSFDVIHGKSQMSLIADLAAIDPSKLAATLKFTVNGVFADYQFHNIEAGIGNGRGLPINPRIILYEVHESSFNNNQNPTYLNYTLSGNPLRYPFDSYTINTKVVVQEKDIDITGNRFVSNDLFRNDWFVNGDKTETYVVEDATHIDREIKVVRNSFQTFGIIIPVIAGFFLLGATTVLRDKTNHLAIRMTITIGIFALVFSVAPLIESKKPFTYGIYTIADGLLNALLAMTAIYAVFAILSYRYKAFNSRFESLFGIISAIMVVLSAIPVKWDEELQLILLIIFSLSYGFLTRPTWSVIGARLRWRFTR